MSSVSDLKQKDLLIGPSFNSDKKKLTHSYIESIASLYPKNTAVTSGDDKINYHALNESANKLAHYLITHGNVLPGDFIGIYFTPSIKLIIAILAIIKTGAAYIPLDLSYPKKFVDFIVSNSNPKLILSNLSTHINSKNTLNIDDISYDDLPNTNPLIQVNPENPLYVIYTSGSTGEPKGVLIPHRAAINHMVWMQNEFNFKEDEKILLKTPLTFDPSVWEIFIPLFVGAELIIAPSGSHIDTNQLFNTITYHQVTTVQFVPTILDKFLNHPSISRCSSLKRVFVGGESLLSKTKTLFFKKLNCALINLYGPTETTIDITYHVVNNTSEELDRNYIGKPIYNTELYVLNENMEECDFNQEGELFISGESVGLGYLNKPEITKASFVPHLYFEKKMMYKTGDIVRYDKNGLIEYIGRKDKQTKINGVRVELSAIISKVMENKSIAECFVVKSSGDENSFVYLICYLVPKDGNKIDITEIKNTLSNFFPKAVMPKEFYIIDEIPLLPNGKIDQNMLERESKVIRNEKIASFEEREHIQDILLQMCRHLIHSDIVDVNEDLYDSGIDSLSCLILIEKIEKEFHVDLLVHEILSHKTIHSLSNLILNKIKHVNEDTKSNNNTIVALKPTGNKTPLFLIHPIGGTVFWYYNIAKYFDSDRPVYGIQDPGIESEDYRFNTIEEMAAYYFSHIKNVQPHGPYIIGGASFGATIAVEISRHLKKQEVLAIPVLDGWGIYPDELKDENYFRESMIKQQNDWRDKFGVYCKKEFQKLFATQQHRLELLYKYKMKDINHNLFLFKSKEIMDIFKPIDCPDNNWGKYTRGRVEIINAEGNHETMFQKPHIKDLAEKISKLLDEL